MPKYWHDLEKTMPATAGMTVAVVQGLAFADGKPLDVVQADPKLRPTIPPRGGLSFAPDPAWALTQEIDPNLPVYIGRRAGGRVDAGEAECLGGAVFNCDLTSGDAQAVEWLVGRGFYKLAAKLYGGTVIPPHRNTLAAS